MSFKSYAVHPLSDGGLVLTGPEPLVFSGRHGIVARFILGTSRPMTAAWRVSADDLHRIALPDLDATSRLIVFEQTHEEDIELLALESVHGISRERTEMMFTFRPLILLSATRGLHVRRTTTEKTYTEELVLEGGVLAPMASWRWRRPHLALGGVVVGAGAPGSEALRR